LFFYSAREFYSRNLYGQVERQSPSNVSVYLSRLPSPYSLSKVRWPMPMVVE
jgi:hypothetical protein